MSHIQYTERQVGLHHISQRRLIQLEQAHLKCCRSDFLTSHDTATVHPLKDEVWITKVFASVLNQTKGILFTYVHVGQVFDI